MVKMSALKMLNPPYLIIKNNISLIDRFTDILQIDMLLIYSFILMGGNLPIWHIFILHPFGNCFIFNINPKSDARKTLKQESF